MIKSFFVICDYNFFFYGVYPDIFRGKSTILAICEFSSKIRNHNENNLEINSNWC